MARKEFSIPELFPLPKKLEVLDGQSDLALDVRLVTANVYPLQRKAIRSVLGEAGVRVVANKKKYVVEARVEDSSAFDLKKIPLSARKEYYELTLKGSEITVRAPEQDGTVWGMQTAATLFRVFQQGRKLPNLRIEDWPVLAFRGVTLRSSALMDKMTLPEWMQCIDSLAALKLNCFGLELYGNAPSPRVNIPVPGQDGWQTIQKLEWYSPTKDISGTEEEAPYLRSKEGLFNGVVTYGEEKGVHLYPVMDILDGSDYLASKSDDYCAKDRSGRPLGRGVCFSSAAGRKFVEELVSSALEQYFPDGAELFELRMGTEAKVRCQCRACAKKKPSALLQDYILWLVKFLLEKQVRRIVLWNEGRPDAAFEKKLEKLASKERLLLLWPDRDDQKSFAWKGSAFPAGAVMPADFQLPTMARLKEIHAMASAAEKGKADGVAMDCVYRPQHLEGEALLAVCAWEGTKGLVPADVLKRWYFCRFGARAAEIEKVQGALAEAEVNPVYQLCMEPESGFGTATPAECLAALERRKDSLAQLKKVCEKAASARKILERLLAKEPGAQDLQMLLAECAEVEGVSDVYAYLLGVRRDLTGKPVTRKAVDAAEEKQEQFNAKILQVENGLPLWLAPYGLHRTGKLHRILEGLLEHLKEQLQRKRVMKFAWK